MRQPGQPILCVIGTRPNLMKMAPVMRALRSLPRPIAARLLHTGQHYDQAMNEQFFDELGLSWPDINLEVGSGTHSEQTAHIMLRFEPILRAENPAAVLVVGDVNSTLACALVAAKHNVPVIHVEAGLRSFDRTMPEEINRVLTDQLSDYLFTTERSARSNLELEGIAAERIHFVGNVMIDTLQEQLPRAIPGRQTLRDVRAPDVVVSAPRYAVLTLHRPSNVDDRSTLSELLDTIVDISRQIPVIWPLHPRTRARIEEFNFADALRAHAVVTIGPLGYLSMLGLIRDAAVVLTDSGGIQEETTALGVPCVTLRENTERPITVDEGTNTIAGRNGNVILGTVADILTTGGKRGRIPELWDGKAAGRIATTLAERF